MQSVHSLIARAAGYFGAHQVPQRDDHERERAYQRVCVTLAILVAWIYQWMHGGAMTATRLSLVGCCAALAVLNLHHLQRLRVRPGSGIGLQYAFLATDPILLVVLLAEDPQTFGFLHPFLMVVILHCGLRYGTRSLWLSWAIAIAASAIVLPGSEYWRSRDDLAVSYIVSLVFVPLFFPALIRRIHNVRILEQERARVEAMQEVVTARSAFLAKVSHELRSPLQSIVSALDVFEMRHRHGLSEDDELIGRMRRSSMLLNTQLRDLLTLARGEAGRLEMHPEPFEACGLVDGVVLAARDEAREKGLDVRVDMPLDAVFVVADGARIDQVLTNLVVNSVRYTHLGQVRVTLHPYDTVAKCLRFTVADTGPGIPADRLATLFEPDKLVSTSDRKGEGSGIGLAVVRTLVEHLGGTVTVDSKENVGTTFEVAIPAELIDPETSTSGTGALAGRILIVDDREDILTGLTAVVNELGFECDRASTTAVAANLLAIRRYDAVLLDIQMPVKSGIELAEEIRRGKGPNQDTRLLGMSAAAVAAQYADGPFDACLAKPIDRSALIGALRDEWPETWPSSTI
jgi:signal transduction histidine kinase/ActR/RegA family two-component response regulator